jgi:hypothetical protein
MSDKSPLMEGIEPENFVTNGCADFVYGQVRATISLADEKMEEVNRIKDWISKARSLKLTELESWLQRYYSSGLEGVENSRKKIQPMIDLIKQAQLVDGQETVTTK